jgi:hypothetical protein
MTNIFGTEHTATHGSHMGGDQYTFSFENGYGASVIRNSMSYGHEDGKWELAVLQGEAITYDTPLTDDVIGWLDEAEVGEKLTEIEALPKAGA